jgi:hypothetical protein
MFCRQSLLELMKSFIAFIVLLLRSLLLMLASSLTCRLSGHRVHCRSVHALAGWQSAVVLGVLLLLLWCGLLLFLGLAWLHQHQRAVCVGRSENMVASNVNGHCLLLRLAVDPVVVVLLQQKIVGGLGRLDVS